MCLVVVGGPLQQVLRPAQIEDAALSTWIRREALFGVVPVLDPDEGTKPSIQGNALVVEQSRSSVFIDELGSIRLIQPARRTEARGRGELPVLLQEDIQERIARGLRFAALLLDQVDPIHRITDVVPVVALVGVGSMGWRTRAEHEAQPNTYPAGHGSSTVQVHLTPAAHKRATLTHETDRLAEDFTVLLRRQMRRDGGY